MNAWQKRRAHRHHSLAGARPNHSSNSTSAEVLQHDRVPQYLVARLPARDSSPSKFFRPSSHHAAGGEPDQAGVNEGCLINDIAAADTRGVLDRVRGVHGHVGDALQVGGMGFGAG